MPSKPRLFVSGGIYHVYCRTHRGEMRFGREDDARHFVRTVKMVASSHQLTILGYALMSNHYHLVVRTGDVMLWRSMAAIHARITRNHNRKQRVYGSGWQSRYRARLIQDDEDLRYLLAYVHLNPVVAGLADDPVEYALSGHRELIGRSKPSLVNAPMALRCFGENSAGEARRAYLQYLRAVADAKWASGSLRQLPWWKNVKDDYQIVDEEHAPAEARTFDDAIPELPPSPDEDPNELLQRTCAWLGVSRDEITGHSRSRALSLARRRFVFIAITHFRHLGVSVAKAMGKSPCQVSRWLSAETRVCSFDSKEDEFMKRIVVGLLSVQLPKNDSP